MAIQTGEFFNSAYLIYPRDGFDQLDFNFGADTQVYQSCSVQWQNRYYVFGGSYGGEMRQVSVVNGNRLERIATLDFYFGQGACTVLNHQTIVLCFDEEERDMCRQSNNPLRSFTRLPRSNYEHSQIPIASFDGKNTDY